MQNSSEYLRRRLLPIGFKDLGQNIFKYLDTREFNLNSPNFSGKGKNELIALLIKCICVRGYIQGESGGPLDLWK